ncbi:hypothetical protein [Nostoc sp. XA010]|uniref:hypothetical protein n=1 Tax=Nostoc sp. XA010 TaxID=2780407 RepID=UPI00226D7F33|nr:hypothetical protein [Nostoc sp. XA010]
MKLPPKITIADHFKNLEDKIVERTKKHKLIDIVTIVLIITENGAIAPNKLAKSQLKQLPIGLNPN